MKARRHIHGTTLIELMTTVSVVAATLTLGVPTFGNIQAAVYRGQATTELVTSFMLARSEAARRGSPVTVCASSGGQTCVTGTSPNWHNGWIVFTDAHGRRRPCNNGTDEILHVAHFDRTGFDITPASAIAASDGRPDGVTFEGNGYPRNVWHLCLL